MNCFHIFYLALPIIFSVIYFWVLLKEWLIHLNITIIKRAYYLISFIWVFGLIIVFYQKISSLKIMTNYPFDSSVFNIGSTIVILLVFIIVWDILFISCRTIKNFKFKDMELSIEEIQYIKNTNIVRENTQKTLYRVIETYSKLIFDMKKYVNIIETDPYNTYIDLIRRYERIRKDIKIYVYTNDEKGINKLKKELNIKDDECSAILYAIKYNGSCTPKNKGKDIIYAFINTITIKEDLLIVIKGDFLIVNEHLIIQSIINNYHLNIEFQIAELEIIELSCEKVENN